MSITTESFDNNSAVAMLDEPQPSPAPQPAPTRPRMSRYQSLDMWRGLACLMLVIYHGTFYAEHSWKSGDSSTWTIGGLAVNLMGRLWIGVPIFFVVSGYCIAASSDASRRRPHSLWLYFSRRFRRIYPPLWIACLLCIVVALAASCSETIREGCKQLPPIADFTMGNWIGNFTASEAWRWNLTGGEIGYLMNNTWTLCYEEQFYAVVGLILLVCKQRFFTAAGVITLATLAVRHVVRASGGVCQGFFCDGHWLLFAVGILVYYRLQYATQRFRWATIATLLATVAYAVVDYRRAGTHFEKHLDEYLLTAALFGLVLVKLYRIDGRLMASRLLQPLLWYGKMSYSVYLTHFPVVVITAFLLSRIGSTADWFVALVTVPLSVAISIPVGRAFYWAVERHFMNAPLEKKAAAPVAVSCSSAAGV